MAQKTTFEPTVLDRELALRGLTPEEFSKEAAISMPTIYRALRGDAISVRSRSRILAALSRLPSLNVSADLMRSA